MLRTYNTTVQAAIGSGVEDVREVRQRLVTLESSITKMQRQEDKRGVEVLQKLSAQEVSTLTFLPFFKKKGPTFAPFLFACLAACVLIGQCPSLFSHLSDDSPALPLHVCHEYSACAMRIELCLTAFMINANNLCSSALLFGD